MKSIIVKKAIIIGFFTSLFWGCATVKSGVITLSDVEADPFRYVMGSVTSTKLDEETLMRAYKLKGEGTKFPSGTKFLSYCPIKQAVDEPVIYDREEKELHFLRVENKRTGTPTICKVRSVQ